ncbi:MAG TPA: EAL domain-containing protein [Solirubrobacteraceae bacterium]|jgi:diguanylate cyclase (GGDEF)-like protein/PAS domain S-box-containing protein|nr:EAL domain-containing protein [Solirubrobacteraceae bacterium]
MVRFVVLRSPALFAAWLVAVLFLATAVDTVQRDSRRDLEQRFEARADAASRFVGAYTRDVLARQRALADRHLSARRVDRESFEHAVELTGHHAAVLLDWRGRAMHVSPAAPRLTGAPLGRRYPHLRRALTGRTAVSPVVSSAARGEPLVAFAVPFGPAGRRRVFSSGYTIARTPLAAYLANAVPFRTAAVRLVDSSGAVVAAHEPPPGERGGDRFHAERRVAGTPWRVMLSVPRRVLYEPADGPARWVPWLVLAILAVGGLLAVRLGAKLVDTRRRLEEDIREREQAERRNREAEARFARAFDEGPIGMAIVGLDGHWLRVNRAMCEMTGYAAEDFVGMSFDDLTHPEDVAIGVDQLMAAVSGDVDRFEVEKRLITASGDEIVVLLSGALVRDDLGRPLYFLSHTSDVTERRMSQHRLEYLADHDSLTGLLNRRRFDQELERQLAHTRRYGNPATLLMLDLDHFKVVNDTFGHAVGDELISRLADALRDRVRTTDIVARLGGDEFGLLLPETTVEQAETLAADLLELVHREGHVVRDDCAVRVTASIGVATLDPAREQTAEEVLIDADVAMYQAKDGGRATYAVRDPEDDRAERLTSSVVWADRIRDAIANDGFVLYQQPILDLHTGEVARHEVLLRMVGDDGDHIPPAVFLYVAERFGLVADVDAWVVRHAMQLIADRARADHRLELEVNLSGASITNPRVVEAIDEGLRETGIDPSTLTFEITETAAISNIDKARRFAEHLIDLGCRFALDDFGAGFGSFYYLKHLPFDTLKIDGEFVRDLAGSPRDQIMVRSIAQLAASLGSHTVAEFVQDEATQQLLAEYGVDFAQGYLIGRPQPVATTWPAPAAAHA